MLDFDVIFLDTTSPRYYDRSTLEKEAMGGSEASVVRIAEGLGKLGLKVAVIEAKLKNYFEPIIGQYAYFFHSDDVERLNCKHYIQIRANTNPQLFPGSKKYIWLHDVATQEREGAWLSSLSEYNIQLIGVSRWHRNNIREVTGVDSVRYIYNPVPDEIYVHAGINLPYDSNLMVWMSSPHKGLNSAAVLFKRVKELNPKMQLVVFNPGYCKADSEALMVQPGVSVYGSMDCRRMWGVVQKSLCVFYPTEYQETFGLVVAEANALGIPVCTNPVAALKEVVSSNLQLVDTDQDVVNTVLDWSKTGRPKITGLDEFRESNVLVEWVKLLAR